MASKSKKSEEPKPFTDQEMAASAGAEQMALMEAQIEHLTNRCVLLHANLLRAQTENAALIEQLNKVKKPQDRKKEKA